MYKPAIQSELSQFSAHAAKNSGGSFVKYKQNMTQMRANIKRTRNME